MRRCDLVGTGVRLGGVWLLLLTGCAGLQRPWARSTEGFSEYRTAHFRLVTDLPPPDAQEAARYLERTRQALLSAAWPQVQLPVTQPIEARVLKSDADFRRLYGRFVDAFFTRALSPPRLVLHGAPSHWVVAPGRASVTSSVLNHELTHYLAAYLYLRQPRWFSEGLAQFLETVRASADGRSVELASPSANGLLQYRRYPTPAARALAWGVTLEPASEDEARGLYGESWALVFFLYHLHTEAFAAFQNALGQGMEPSRAWSQFLGGLTDGLDARVKSYLERGDFQRFEVPLGPVDTSVRVRALAPAEVHAVRAELAMMAAELSPEAADDAAHEADMEMELALAADPTNVDALAARLPEAGPGQAVALAERATAAHPRDARAWVLLGSALRATGAPSARAREAFLRATELAPDDPVAFHALALQALQEGRAADAVSFATQSARLAPWNPGFLDTLAAGLAHQQRCPLALAAEERAVDVLPEDVSGTDAAPLFANLARYRAQCGSR